VPRPLLSVCVCVFDRIEVLADALWSLAGQSAAPELYEVVVVDNGVPDRAALDALLEAFLTRPLAIRCVREERLGLSHARNRGVRECAGEYVLFFDDDAVANPRLIERYAEILVKERPDVFGGNLQPCFERMPPPELDYSHWFRWSLKHFGPRTRWLQDGEYFLGANVGAARALLAEHPFDPSLGRCGSGLGGGEELFLGDARFRRLFVAGADAFHVVPAERLSLDYLARRSGASGATSLSRNPPARSTPQQGSGWLLRELLLLWRKLSFGMRLLRRVRALRRAHEASRT
jgi:glycosyltransferase involved in cell wall biosynthesis